MITERDKKIAVYGAIQRMLEKVSKEYPYTSEDFGFEVGFCPERFDLVLGLSHQIMHFDDNFTQFKPELGDRLLQELMDNPDIVGNPLIEERLFAADIEFNTEDSDGRD